MTKEEALEHRLTGYELICGCAEIDEVCKTLVPILEQIDRPSSEPGYAYERAARAANITVGAYYIIIEALEKVNPELVWHGSSARFPTLSDAGRELLTEMKGFLNDHTV